MNKFINFIILFLSFMGLIGGIGYTIWCGAYPISLGIVALGYLAYKEFVKRFKEFID